MQEYNGWELLKRILGEKLSIMCSGVSVMASISWTQMCICKFNSTWLMKSLQSSRLSSFTTPQDIILIRVDEFYYECNWNGARIIVQQTKMICLKKMFYYDQEFQCQFNTRQFSTLMTSFGNLDGGAGHKNTRYQRYVCFMTYLCILGEISCG